MTKCNDYSLQEVLNYAAIPLSIISTKHFSYLHREIGYEGRFIPEMRTIAQRYVEIELLNTGISLPYRSVPSYFYDGDAIFVAWKALMAELEKLGLDTDICNWIEKIRVEKRLFLYMILGDWVNKILVPWATDRINYPAFKIASDKMKGLKIIVMKHYISSITFKLHDIPELYVWTENDVWENYIVNSRDTKSAMSNWKKLCEAIDFWVAFYQLLSVEEVNSLEGWANAFVATWKYKPSLFSLTQLANDLRNRGYLSS